MDVDLVAHLSAHPVFDALGLAHRNAGREDAPRRRLVRIGPVHRPEAGEPALQPPDNRVAAADLRPSATIDIEAQDSRHLLKHRGRIGIAVNVAMNGLGVRLRQADAGWFPSGIGQKREV
jgi:hypothetical protein